MEGGQSHKGCGYNPWLFSCCIPEAQMLRQSVPNRRKIPMNSQKVLQKRRYEGNEIAYPNQHNCGIPRTPSNTLQQRIIGGRPARFAEFPWQSHIRIKEYQCGGGELCGSRRHD